MLRHQNQRQVGEVLAHALAFAQRVDTRRVHGRWYRGRTRVRCAPHCAAAITASCGSWYFEIRLPTAWMRLLPGAYLVGPSTSSTGPITASETGRPS